jgi:hypothetical protein
MGLRSKMRAGSQRSFVDKSSVILSADELARMRMESVTVSETDMVKERERAEVEKRRKQTTAQVD